MSDQVERLKGKSIQFSIDLIKKRLSDDLITELTVANEKFKEVKILYRDIETNHELITLKQFIYQNKSKISRELFDSCIEELREITEDFKWSNSKDGKAILRLESWVIEARNQLIGAKGYETIFIGRDYFNPTILIISGIIENELKENKLKEKIEQLNPPTIPKYFIERPQ